MKVWEYLCLNMLPISLAVVSLIPVHPLTRVTLPPMLPAVLQSRAENCILFGISCIILGIYSRDFDQCGSFKYIFERNY